jgi:CRISPR/Cas system CSM-associated protein Csm3 (group 7 of RAMP superfamily)
MEQQKFTMQIILLSDTLIGSAEGYGAIIDKDSVFDEVGLPIIPGKRIKGILREQAELFQLFGNSLMDVDILFGKSGLTNKITEYLSVSSFVLPDYEANKTYLKYLIQKKIISRSEVMEYFTSLRMMTSIDKDGIAADTSLRTFRVLNKGLVFTGELHFDPAHEKIFENIVSLTRRIGSMRNRGLGHIQCKLFAPVYQEMETEKSLAV